MKQTIGQNLSPLSNSKSLEPLCGTANQRKVWLEHYFVAPDGEFILSFRRETSTNSPKAILGKQFYAVEDGRCVDAGDED